MHCPLRPPRKDGGERRFDFFEVFGNKATFRGETIAHYAALAELVLDHGWPRELITVESPPHGDLHAGALDMVVRTPDSGRERYWLGAEAKSTESKLMLLVDGVNRCEGAVSPPHPSEDHNKCLGLLAFRPRLFGASRSAAGCCAGSSTLTTRRCAWTRCAWTRCA